MDNINSSVLKLLNKYYSGLIIKDQTLNYSNYIIDCITTQNKECKYDLKKIFCDRYNNFSKPSSTKSISSSKSSSNKTSKSLSKGIILKLDKKLFDFTYTNIDKDYYFSRIFDRKHSYRFDLEEEIRGIYLCFFHIDEFDISSLKITTKSAPHLNYIYKSPFAKPYYLFLFLVICFHYNNP